MIPGAAGCDAKKPKRNLPVVQGGTDPDYCQDRVMAGEQDPDLGGSQQVYDKSERYDDEVEPTNGRNGAKRRPCDQK